MVGEGTPGHREPPRARSEGQGWPDSSVWAVTGVAVATAIFWYIRHVLGKGHAALLYLPVVVLAARLGGTRAGLLAALLSFFSWNFFFIPPYYTFTIRDPKDWISLVVFLIVGLAMGLQTGRMREREAEARAREREASLLYRLSADLASQPGTQEMALMLASETAHAVGATCAALFLPNATDDLRVVPSKPDGGAAMLGTVGTLARWVLREVKAVGLPRLLDASGTRSTRWPITATEEEARRASGDEDGTGELLRGVFLPLQGATQAEGVVYVGPRADGSPYGPSEARLLVSIANLAASFLERQRLQALAAQAEALREADRLKNSLISSVSHELKTPLSSVTATVTSLLEEDVDWSPEEIRQELRSVSGSLGRLSESISNLLDLSRLEAGAWEPRRDWHGLGEILGAVRSHLPRDQRGRLCFDLPEDLLPVWVDFAQLARALQNLVENALAYSPPGSPVHLGADVQPSEVRVWVQDEGPGVAPEERQRIFGKFVRGAASPALPSGTGLGLAISQEIARSHGGRVWVEDVQPRGARFVIAFPRGAGGR